MATAPPAPDAVTFTNIGATTVTAHTETNGNGGSPITIMKIGYSTSTTAPALFVNANLSTGFADVTGLGMSKTYYFWANCTNAIGTGAWSPRSFVRTLSTPLAPSIPTLSNPTQTSVDVVFTDGSNGGSAITGREIGYSTSSAGPTTIVPSDGSTTVTGLGPGTVYYFWARTVNAFGPGVWSAASNIRTQAGAWITVGGVVHPAVPWVKVGGIWKPATPWGRVAGAWRKAL